jgi:hypothetical protein
VRYDANQAPDSEDWFERIDLVVAYHREVQLPGDGDELHIAVRVAIEHNIARCPTEVSWMLTRLMDEGLSRHDAVHAIGDVLLGILGDAVATAAVTSKHGIRDREDWLTSIGVISVPRSVRCRSKHSRPIE